MKKIAIALVLLCAGCADPAATADLSADHHQTVRASSFIYDPHAEPITLDMGTIVLDPNAPPLRAREFRFSRL